MVIDFTVKFYDSLAVDAPATLEVEINDNGSFAVKTITLPFTFTETLDRYSLIYALHRHMRTYALTYWSGVLLTNTTREVKYTTTKGGNVQEFTIQFNNNENITSSTGVGFPFPLLVNEAENIITVIRQNIAYLKDHDRKKITVEKYVP